MESYVCMQSRLEKTKQTTNPPKNITKHPLEKRGKKKKPTKQTKNQPPKVRKKRKKQERKNKNNEIKNKKTNGEKKTYKAVDNFRQRVLLLGNVEHICKCTV